MNNKNIHPVWTLTIGAASYILAFAVFNTASVIGDAFKLLGFICVILAIVGFIESAVRKNRNK